MSRKILFSPIGGTDPIKYMRDGSMLHICRHYKPDIVYLYLSHEMMEYHMKDNRYVDAIKRLGAHLDHVFDVRLIERDELINVQQYDVFYHDFREEIIRIEKDMEEGDELLLNMASGTPAMKSALLVMATFAEYRFKPIQVSTPIKSMNDKPDDRKEYEPELYWELNEDNQESAENRCTEVKSLNLMKMIKMEIIKKHVMAYDYVAALTVASEMKDDLSENAYDLLKIMDARVKLDHKTISRFLANKKYDIYPVSESNKQKVFEYALVLQMKLKKQEYVDFIRGITPLTVDLLEDILRKKCGIKLDDCCVQEKDNMRKWDQKKLEAAGLAVLLERAYPGGFKYGPVYSTHIAKIIEQKCSDVRLIQQINEMVYIEGVVRNVAAHEIVSVTDEWLRDRTKSESKAGKTAREIFEILKYIMREAGIIAKKEDWQSYDKVNQRIVQELQ
ncbi:MAG: CRISPR-associated protein Csm6 [Clostridiales bacterium]|nr:CRISPR-associated protein Csm6 [Clostridiales bacterium]